MKVTYKLLLAMLVLAVFTSTNAQNISMNPPVKTVEARVEKENATSVQMVITNNSPSANDTMITWKIISFEKPTGWKLDFCDPYYCLANQTEGSNGHFELKTGKSGPLKCDFYDTTGLGLGGTATVKMVLTYENGSPNSDTATFIVKGWATGLKTIRNAAEISLYPNPSRHEITLKYPVNKPIEVSVYNVLGSRVKTFVHNGSETTFNISDLQKGLYFIRFIQGDVMVSKSFTKAD
jgi:hypothetical protein